MIIDCHGHYTSAPAALTGFRTAQLACGCDAHRLAALAAPQISDDEIRESLEGAQLRVQRERGVDMTLFSPRASAMGHHLGDLATSAQWARACNDLIARVVDLYPRNFAGVCQLPQSPGGDLGDSVAELERCIGALGFVGCNLSPDPSGGRWTAPPLYDPYWFPIFEALEALDAPAMIHVSASCTPAFHTTGAHYINADTTAFMQLVEGDVFTRFPRLRLVIPHGGGAAPYHWGRYRGLAQDLGRPPLDEGLLRNVFFDTCVYHQAGIDLLLKVVPLKNILFGSETLGAVRGVDPTTGFNYDDTRRYIEAAPLSDAARTRIFAGNALDVYPRLAQRLAATA